MDYVVEDWLCRFVAHHRSATVPEVVDVSPMDEVIDNLVEGYSRAQEIMQVARSKYGSQLMWIEIETLDRAGQWNAVRRFYAERFE